MSSPAVEAASASSPAPAPASASREPSLWRRRLVKAALLAAMAWCGFALGSEILDNAQHFARLDGRAEVRPRQIRLGSSHEAALKKFLRRAEGALPLAEPVCLLADPATSRSEYFFLSLWVSYLLPRHHIRRLAPAKVPSGVSYCIAYRTRFDRPQLRLVNESNQGALYRVQR